ncbi:family 43 glycosylhydrolase [Propioniciclava coleopterorum]|uniref:Family 43 glycosylhydrolase n=1 Tax=Propioniciclava coleopterorum TaxID=2714937 RepID=A0A6G7Y4A2_9ACTN|nr:family 43 glycosylhydrolase [Propioniciclava coleopterorum]
MTRRPLARSSLATLLACGLLAAGGASPALADPGDAPGTFHNYVGQDQVDAFSDPTIIRGQDGYWYMYASQTVMRKDNTSGSHVMPMMRSSDLVDWTYIGDVFTAANAPTWWPFEGSLFWAPDIRYINGTYYLYYSFNRPGKDQAIGLATSDSPAGPWTDIGHPVVNINDGTNEIDSSLYIGEDGTKYLYYGSFGNGGIKVVRLNAEGTASVGTPQRVVAPAAARRRTWSSATAGTTCSTPASAAATAPRAPTRCSPDAPAARWVPSSTARASTSTRCIRAGRSCSPPTATAGSRSGTAPTSPTPRARPG